MALRRGEACHARTRAAGSIGIAALATSFRRAPQGGGRDSVKADLTRAVQVEVAPDQRTRTMPQSPPFAAPTIDEVPESQVQNEIQVYSQDPGYLICVVGRYVVKIVKDAVTAT